LFFAKTSITEFKPYKLVQKIEIEIEIFVSDLPGVRRCPAVHQSRGQEQGGGRVLAEAASGLLSL
jgi:hypothetical protein